MRTTKLLFALTLLILALLTFTFPGTQRPLEARCRNSAAKTSSLRAYSWCRLFVMIDEDIRRCAKMLESVVRMSGLSARQLEERLDYGAGTVNRLFSGKIELKLRHMLLILDSIGIPPSQFFREAFPDDGRPRSEPEMASRLLDLLERHVPKKAARSEAPTVTDEDLDRRILETLGRLGVLPQQPSPPPQPPDGRKKR